MIDEKKLIEDLKTWGGDVESLVDYINNMPKVGEWIPCSSGKLPQRQDSENFNLEMYLVRLKDNRIRLGYRDEKGTWRNEHWNKLNVIEWKPIDTEPYRGDEK